MNASLFGAYGQHAVENTRENLIQIISQRYIYELIEEVH